jgi:hypothetical protein
MARKSPQHKPVVTRIPLTEARINLGAIVSACPPATSASSLRRTVCPSPP